MLIRKWAMDILTSARRALNVMFKNGTTHQKAEKGYANTSNGDSSNRYAKSKFSNMRERGKTIIRENIEPITPLQTRFGMVALYDNHVKLAVTQSLKHITTTIEKYYLCGGCALSIIEKHTDKSLES